MQQLVYYFLIIGIVLFFVLVADYFWASKKLRELNNKISHNKNYLKDKNKRELCKAILNQTNMYGIFTLMESRKLKKALDQYQ